MKNREDSIRAALWERFECQKCGRCCAEIGLPFYGLQLEKIANFLGLSRDQVIERYYGRIVVENGKKMVEFEDDKRTPCPFLLDDNTCRIYPVRPEGCQAYPIDTDLRAQGVDCPGYALLH